MITFISDAEFVAKQKNLAERKAIERALREAARKLGIPQIFPSHPRYEEVQKFAQWVYANPDEGVNIQNWEEAGQELRDYGLRPRRADGAQTVR